MEEKEIKERVRKAYKNFKATVVMNTSDFFIVDWKNENGDNNQSSRFYIDINRGTFMVSGDMGDSIACWYNPVYPKALKEYLNSIRYYLQKIQCSSELYTYNQHDIDDDLNDLYKEWKRDVEENGEDMEAFEDDFEELRYLFGCYDGGSYSTQIIDILEKYDECWFESSASNIGERIDHRLYYWTVGYQMACEQLGI